MEFKKNNKNSPIDFFPITVCFILAIIAAIVSGKIISDNQLTFLFLGEKVSAFFWGSLVQIAMVIFFFIIVFWSEKKFWKKLFFFILTFSTVFTISFLILTQWNWLIFFAGPLIITILSIISAIIIFITIVIHVIIVVLVFAFLIITVFAGIFIIFLILGCLLIFGGLILKLFKKSPKKILKKKS